MHQISVIIPLYNRKDLIGYTLNSLQQEHHPGVELEVIVVDDGSTDGAAGFVQEAYPWVQLHKNPKKGAPSARNHGLSLAKHKFIQFLDSDDLVRPNFYRTKIEYLKQNPHVGAVYSHWIHFNAKGAFVPESEIKLHAQYPIEPVFDKTKHLARLLSGWYIPINAFVHRKSHLLHIGGFDESLKINQDVDLTFRLLCIYEVQGISEPVVLVRQHDLVDRVGAANKEDKIVQILALRKHFIAKLKADNILSPSLLDAAAEYGFNRWKEYRTTFPTQAQCFLDFSKQCNPKLQIKGSKSYKILANILGNEKAYLLKERLSKILRK